MSRKAGARICVLMLTAVLSGCRFIRIEEGERTPLDYTVMKQEEIPREYRVCVSYAVVYLSYQRTSWWKVPRMADLSVLMGM